MIRLAVKQDLSPIWMMDNPDLGRLWDHLQTALGRDVMIYLSQNKDPHTICYEQKMLVGPMIEMDDRYRAVIEVRLEKVKMMKMVYAELPSMKFDIYRDPKRTSTGEEDHLWQCGHCGQTNDFKVDLCCRFCGGPR